MPIRKTLKEIAEIYRCSTKTFRKHVHELGIPHEKLGASMRFDEEEVKQFLRAEPRATRPVERIALRGKRKTVSSRFAAAVGIEDE
jgi:excisionase family DNA binding protein